MRAFMSSQKFIDIGNSALAVDTDLPGAESLLDLLETELDNTIADGHIPPLHPDAIDDYLYATWALHISWSALRNRTWTYLRKTRANARKIPGQERDHKTP